MLAGVDFNTMAATFSKEIYIPEFAYVIFQMTFACITPALIVGAFAERMKFSAMLLFLVTLVHLCLSADGPYGLVVGGPRCLHA